MIAEIMAAFPQFSYEYIMKVMTFKQFLLWHMHALKIRYNVELNLSDTLDVNRELDEINNKFTWNEETKRWE